VADFRAFAGRIVNKLAPMPSDQAPCPHFAGNSQPGHITISAIRLVNSTGLLSPT
jgi:hypothetical protein